MKYSEYRNVCILPKHSKTVVIDFQLEICEANNHTCINPIGEGGG